MSALFAATQDRLLRAATAFWFYRCSADRRDEAAESPLKKKFKISREFKC